jgi:hypothetical protein
MINEMSEVLKRWKEYIEDRYSKDTKPIAEDFEMEEENIVDNDQKGPGLIREEVLAATKDMKNGKSVGIDEIPAEFLKMLDTGKVEMLVELCQKMYETGMWPEDFTKAVMIPIPKKVGAS